MDDLIRFALLAAAALALCALYLIAVRLSIGDGRVALDPSILGTVIILSVAALAGAALVAFAHRAAVGSLLSVAMGFVLMVGGSLLLGAIMPKVLEAAGPGAMAMLFPFFASAAAVPLGLMLRAVAALL